mgnify:FL=1
MTKWRILKPREMLHQPRHRDGRCTWGQRMGPRLQKFTNDRQHRPAVRKRNHRAACPFGSMYSFLTGKPGFSNRRINFSPVVGKMFQVIGEVHEFLEKSRLVPLHCPRQNSPRTNHPLPLIIHNSPFPANTATGVNSALRFKGEKNMKATGIVRRVDDLGRIVIPKEIRRTLRIREGDPLQTSLTRWEMYCFSMLGLAKRRGW